MCELCEDLAEYPDYYWDDTTPIHHCDECGYSGTAEYHVCPVTAFRYLPDGSRVLRGGWSF